MSYDKGKYFNQANEAGSLQLQPSNSYHLTLKRRDARLYDIDSDWVIASFPSTQILLDSPSVPHAISVATNNPLITRIC
uniref:Plastocyanin-like domain-containing protein n=1 Tax=Heterorhabditis bacteriophora TaxID=37862 RepID=A0A1I7WVG9_HETBA